jgi:hypothetical protein
MAKKTTNRDDGEATKKAISDRRLDRRRDYFFAVRAGAFFTYVSNQRIIS